MATVQVQPEPESAVIVRPAGGVSVTVTVPLDGELPTFATVTVYVTVCPGTAMLGLCVLALIRQSRRSGKTGTGNGPTSIGLVTRAVAGVCIPAA